MTQYAIIDIEATGGSPKRDKITEIAVYLFDGNTIVDSFTSLVNPELHIPPFISKLTGITNSMVAEAPTFDKIAQQVLDITKDAIFVAHNVQFDYAYLKNEFKRLGHRFQRRKLCTVQLSKKILPGMASYSLGNLCNELDIPIVNRHRASGDARATVDLFALLLKSDTNGEIKNAINDNYIYQNLPPGIEADMLDRLPEETGIYYLYNQQGSPLFIGKSSDIRRRIFQYLGATQGSKNYKMMHYTHNITFKETGSELIAQLLEMREISRLRPNYNKVHRVRKLRWGMFKHYNVDGILTLIVQKMSYAANHFPHAQLVAAYAKEAYALQIVKAKIEKYNLCPQYCYSQNSKPSLHADGCALVTSKKCNGVCIGTEKVANYNRRVRASIKELEYPHPNFLIVGEGRNSQEKSVVCIENRALVGIGYFSNDVARDITKIRHQLQAYNETPNAHQIVVNYLKKNKLDELVRFDPAVVGC